uniref:Sec-independent protein translocase protein TatB n=1 Tax=Stappia sp. TaxID=1870903 RepID=UPI003BA917F0
MFDIGWTELVVVAVVMILVVGPKDLPRMLRTFGQTMGKVRRMASEFQSTFNDALREAEQQADISDMKRQVEKAGNFDPLGDIRRSVEQDRATKGQGPGGAAAKVEKQAAAPAAEAASAPAGEAGKAAGDTTTAAAEAAPEAPAEAASADPAGDERASRGDKA